jgi:hypothetical protein
MKSVIRQLHAWRFRERLIRVAWGGARWFAILGSVLAFACLADWLVDRYSGSQGWRNFFRKSWVFSNLDPLGIGETPIWFRFLMTLAQLALGGTLAYYFLVRPWVRTPPVDDLATQAEKAYPAFDHRLVTAIQLNRPKADTRGMSQTLIAEVTREAGEIASRHNLLSLVDYRRLAKAAGIAAPVVALWVGFFLVNPALAATLVKRQLQPWADIEIPRTIQLENATGAVYPTGAGVPIRFKVTGDFNKDMVGVIRVVPIAREVTTAPDGTQNVKELDQAEEFYELTYDAPHETEEGAAYFTISTVAGRALPASSRDFSFMARLGDGRTTSASRVRFEAPPQLDRDDPKNPPLTSQLVLPRYLGLDPEGRPFTRRGDGAHRGEVIDALPQSSVIIEARFNKPIAKDSTDSRKIKAWLIRIERDGLRERELSPIQPFEVGKDRLSAAFGFATTKAMIGYRIELEDERGFRNPTQIRRNVRMWDDRPPAVEFKPESTRDPNMYDPFSGGGNPKEYNPKEFEWEMPLTADGVIQVIYAARSEVGVRGANIRYRVIPKGVQFDAYPEAYKAIQHPQNDPNLLVYDRLPLTRFDGKYDMKRLEPFTPNLGLFELIDRLRCAEEGHIGPFDLDLGLFRYSLRGLSRYERNRVNVQFYPLPSRDPANEPAELAAHGRYNFEVGGLLKKIPERLPDGTIILKTAKIEVGDTVELYVEAVDKVGALRPNGQPVLDKNGNPIPDVNRAAGYSREARRKIVVTEAEADIAIRQRDEARQKLQDKLRDLAADQAEVFRPKKP